MQFDHSLADPEDARYMSDVERKADKEQHTIPFLKPITVKAQPISVATRVASISTVIAEVLHNAYSIQAGQPTEPFAHLPGVVQRVYEGCARLAVVPLLEPDRLALAEQAAVKNAAEMVVRYLGEDRGLTAEQCTNIVRAAIALYQHELMRVPR